MKFTSDNERGIAALVNDMNAMGVEVITVGPGQQDHVIERVISVIVPGQGSRSYRVPALPDPTGYYYCTLQLGCCIVEAVCSVHVEVD